MKLLILSMMLVYLSSCQTVTISDKYKVDSRPTFEETQWFFLWGIVPDQKEVEIIKVCKSGRARQMQTLDTVGDKIIRFFTLGLIYPRTAKVWCKK